MIILGGRKMENKLNEIRNNRLIELYIKNNYRYPVERNIIVTKDGKVYQYYNYLNGIKPLEDQNSLSENLWIDKELSDDKINILVKFIETEIVGKNIETEFLRDVKYIVYVNYKDNYIKARNSNLYHKLSELIKNL